MEIVPIKPESKQLFLTNIRILNLDMITGLQIVYSRNFGTAYTNIAVHLFS